MRGNIHIHIFHTCLLVFGEKSGAISPPVSTPFAPLCGKLELECGIRNAEFASSREVMSHKIVENWHSKQDDLVDLTANSLRVLVGTFGNFARCFVPIRISRELESEHVRPLSSVNLSVYSGTQLHPFGSVTPKELWVREEAHNLRGKGSCLFDLFRSLQDKKKQLRYTIRYGSIRVVSKLLVAGLDVAMKDKVRRDGVEGRG